MKLGYGLYRWLQTYVHGDYTMERQLLTTEWNNHIQRGGGTLVLELGCGDGRLSECFNTVYTGIDKSAERIEAARKTYVQHRFVISDFGEGFIPYLKEANFVFCHAVIHHLNDDECRALVKLIDTHVCKPATFVMIEPTLPRVVYNPLGYLLCKLDDGRYIRRAAEYDKVLGYPQTIMRIPPKLRWPVPGVVFAHDYVHKLRCSQ